MTVNGQDSSNCRELRVSLTINNDMKLPRFATSKNLFNSKQDLLQAKQISARLYSNNYDLLVNYVEDGSNVVTNKNLMC